MRHHLVLAVAAGALLAGCSSGPSATPGAPPAAVPSPPAARPSPSPTPSYCPTGRLANGFCSGQGYDAPSPAAPDPVGAIVCPKLFTAQSEGVIYDDIDGMQALGEQAASSADSLIAEKGRALAIAAQTAKHDRGAHTEMGAAATGLTKVCIQSGFTG